MRDRLRELNIIEFWPTYNVKSRWSDRSKILETSLFPAYVFGRFDLCAGWSPILALPGVIRILGSIVEPQPIADSEIETIRRLMSSPELLQPCPFLIAGDVVRIERGPWAGVEGIAVKTKAGGTRVVVSVRQIGSSCSVECDAEWLKKIPTQPLGASRVPASPHS